MTVLGNVLEDSDGRLTDKIGLGILTSLVSRDLVDEVLNTTGRNERRSRLLPARVVVYYVLALTLFYGDAYEEVLRKLVNGLRFLRSWRDEWQVPTTGAISKARIRLGVEPLKELFHRVAVPIAAPGARSGWYRGRRVMAIDGVILDVPDTPENVGRFTKKEHKNGESAYPQVRVVGLAESGTHAMVAGVVASWRVYERELTQRLLPHLEPAMLVLADRGFFSYELWRQASDTGAALAWRVTRSLRLPVEQAYPDGSYRSELLPKQLKTDLHRGQKRRVPEAVRIPVRVIEYRVGNRPCPEVVRLVTTLLDPDQAPAAELATLYAERWEFEIGLDEIETHQIANYRVLRSKKPDLVEQEIWGLLITHYAIRHLMHQAAEDIDIDERRLAFLRSLRIVRRSVTNDADFPPSPA
jgi:hypothetical protein